ncbi:unnamed protein product [Phaeothamnion confervicola]
MRFYWRAFAIAVGAVGPCIAFQVPVDVERFLPPPSLRTRAPTDSLRQGTWFKLICGASLEDVPLIRELALVYTLVGVDCLDVAAEAAVVEAADAGINAALRIGSLINPLAPPLRRPWLMISVNDDASDPHFRKAAFDASRCPPNCPRPCERVCPADAIVFPGSQMERATAGAAAMTFSFLAGNTDGGVLPERCYGCGRCLNVCPLGLIAAKTYVRRPEDVLPLLSRVDAIEIHTKGDVAKFEVTARALWAAPATSNLAAVSVSLPDLGPQMGEKMRAMAAALGPFDGVNIWQTDGRPMSGDVGKGAAAAAVELAGRVLAEPPLPLGEQHFVQLAGGTNAHTVTALRRRGLLPDVGGEGAFSRRAAPDRLPARGLGGAAFGGYARKIVVQALQAAAPNANEGALADFKRVEDDPPALAAALAAAHELFAPWKAHGQLQRRSSIIT